MEQKNEHSDFTFVKRSIGVPLNRAEHSASGSIHASPSPASTSPANPSPANPSPANTSEMLAAQEAPGEAFSVHWQNMRGSQPVAFRRGRRLPPAEATAGQEADAQPDAWEERPPRAPWLHLPEGEPRLLLIQTAAALLLLLIVWLGLTLGGTLFRGAYKELTTRNEVRLSGFFEPIATSSGVAGISSGAAGVSSGTSGAAGASSSISGAADVSSGISGAGGTSSGTGSPAQAPSSVQGAPAA